MHTGQRLRRIKDELRLPVFLEDGIVVVHGYRSVGVPLPGGADAEDGIVQAIGERGRCNHAENCADEDSLQASFQA